MAACSIQCKEVRILMAEAESAAMGRSRFSNPQDFRDFYFREVGYDTALRHVRAMLEEVTRSAA